MLFAGFLVVLFSSLGCLCRDRREAARHAALRACLPARAVGPAGGGHGDVAGGAAVVPAPATSGAYRPARGAAPAQSRALRARRPRLPAATGSPGVADAARATAIGTLPPAARTRRLARRG